MTNKPTNADDASKTGRGHSTVSGEGTARCTACRKTLSVRKFPTRRNTEGAYERALSECRDCRDDRRKSQRAEKDAAKTSAA